MEIVKFIFACFGSFVTAAGFFGGLWARYQKKQEDKIASAQASAREQIKAIEARAREEIKEVREGAITKTDKRRAAEQGFKKIRWISRPHEILPSGKTRNKYGFMTR